MLKASNNNYVKGIFLVSVEYTGGTICKLIANTKILEAGIGDGLAFILLVSSYTTCLWVE